MDDCGDDGEASVSCCCCCCSEYVVWHMCAKNFQLEMMFQLFFVVVILVVPVFRANGNESFSSLWLRVSTSEWNGMDMRASTFEL